jgi:glyoxylase-like metal-dependent hydrolase (beta-lactamase superfamily II)
MNYLKWIGISILILALLAAAGLAFAPTVYVELVHATHSRPGWPAPLISGASLPGTARGMVVDQYWRVQQIAPDTFAIGEPQGDLDNFEYLLIGRNRALLIDAGSTARDIHPALAALTQLPITVIPTHLHSDHTNGLRNFDSIALIDLPETRARVIDGKVHLGRYQYLGTGGETAPVFPVSEWVKPDGYIDLGERRVQVMSTPGHTRTSISVLDPAAHLLFTGDFLYTTTLYAFLPDSSLTTYVRTSDKLLAALPGDTVIYGAHCCRNDEPPGAPWLGMNDLKDARQAVENILAGKADSRGLILRRFPVNGRMTIVTFYPFGNR